MRDKEMEGAKRGGGGVKGSRVRAATNDRRRRQRPLPHSFVILSAPYADEALI